MHTNVLYVSRIVFSPKILPLFFSSVWWPTHLRWSSVCLRCLEGCWPWIDSHKNICSVFLLFWVGLLELFLCSEPSIGPSSSLIALRSSVYSNVSALSPTQRGNINYKHRYFLWVSEALKAEDISSALELLFSVVIKDLQSASVYWVLPDCLPAALGEELGLSSRSLPRYFLLSLPAQSPSLCLCLPLPFFLVSPKLLLCSRHHHCLFHSAVQCYTEAVSRCSTFNLTSLNRFPVSLPSLSRLIGFSFFFFRQCLVCATPILRCV